MIKIVEPEKQYIPKIGDVLWGAATDWAKPEKDEDTSQERISGLKLNALDGTEADGELLLACHIAANPITAMKIIGFDPAVFCPYEDFYTKNTAFGIIPTAIISDDVKKYLPSLKKSIAFPDLAIDQEFIKNSYQDDLYSVFELTEIQTLVMGSGYTYGYVMGDGNNGCVPAKFKLSNGDWLFVWVWEWYNK